MNNMSFEQIVRTGFFKKAKYKFSFFDCGVKVKSNNGSEYDYYFEDFTTNNYVTNDFKNIFIILVAIFCFLLSIPFFILTKVNFFAILLLLASLVLCSWYFWGYRKIKAIVLYENKVLCFNYNSRDKQAVDNFLNELFTKRKVYLKNLYTNFSPNLSFEDQHHNLKWLLGQQIISSDEFNEYLIKLNSHFQKKE